MKTKLNKKIILGSILILVIIYTIFIYQIKDKETINNFAKKFYQERNLTEILPVKEFKSDGCSMWFDNEWIECCVKHDLDYWKGGEKEERKKVDLIFKECLQKKESYILSQSMYLAVRILGQSWIPTPFRWGFGWEYPQYKS